MYPSSAAEYSEPYEQAPKSILLNSTENQRQDLQESSQGRKSIRVSKYVTDGEVTRMKVKYKKQRKNKLLDLTNKVEVFS